MVSGHVRCLWDARVCRNMDDMADQAPETFTATLGGREIEFYYTTSGQQMILQRLTHKIQRDLDTAKDDKQAAALYNKVIQASMDVIETRFVHPEDLDWVLNEVLLGRIDIQEMRIVLANGNTTVLEADDADPKPKIRRPASMKPAAKTAKAPAKTANSRRVTR